MKYESIAAKIIELVGGKDNIEAYTCCMTRLRFVLKDLSNVNEAALKEMPEIKGIVNQAGQYQLVIGAKAEELYREVSKQCPLAQTEDKPAENVKKQSVFNTILSYISGSIAPALSVLIAAGFTSALLTLLTQFQLMSAESPTYFLFNKIATLGFTYLPVMVAFGAAKRLRTNEYLAAFIILVLCSSDVTGTEGLSIFGLSLPAVNYASNIVPALMMVPVMAVIDRYVTKFVPDVVKSAFKPFLLGIGTFIVTVLVIGPIGAFIGNTLGNFCVWLSGFGPVSMALLSALHPILVMFGTHTILTPIFMNETVLYGFSRLSPKALTGNFAMAGATLAVGFKAKKQENKSSSISAGITALLSVTEPALYGTLLRLKKPFVGALIGAGLSGIFLGIFDVKCYAGGPPTIFTMPLYMGGDSMTNFYLACLCAALALVFGFAATWLIGFDET